MVIQSSNLSFNHSISLVQNSNKSGYPPPRINWRPYHLCGLTICDGSSVASVGGVHVASEGMKLVTSGVGIRGSPRYAHKGQVEQGQV